MVAARDRRVSAPLDAQQPRAAFSIVEATIAEMRAALEQGRATSRDIVAQSLDAHRALRGSAARGDHVNPRALEEADERDRERRQRRVRGPLHGIPIALKDNIHTTDMPTTGGALAFAGLVPPYEATLTKNLRDAGAIIIAKTTMTELANWVAAAMPTNYNSLSGFGFNPYDPRRDPRDATGDGRPVLATGGSSSGIGTAAELLGGQRRHRDVGLDPQPVEPEHAGRHQADGRTHQPLRRDSDHRRSGHARSDGALGRRRRDPARRAGRRRARSQRCGDEHVHAAAAARLHEVPASRGAEGRAHRHPARVLLRRRGHPGERGSNGGSERRAEARS